MFSLSGCFHSKPDIHTIHRTTQIAKTNHVYSYNTYHTVKKGDSLFKIGKQFGVSYHDLAKRNHLHYPYTIYVGQKIYLSPPSVIPSKTRRKSPKSHRKETHKAQHSTTSITPLAVHLRWPVQGHISSPFGRRGSRMHDGIDIAVKDGTAVHAAAAGTVVHAGARLSGYGKLIIIRHSNRLFTAYAHNQQLLVHVGDKVQGGQVIAKSGHSGHSTGSHLHFEVRMGTKPVNPIRYLPRKPNK